MTKICSPGTSIILIYICFLISKFMYQTAVMAPWQVPSLQHTVEQKCKATKPKPEP